MNSKRFRFMLLTAALSAVVPVAMATPGSGEAGIHGAIGIKLPAACTAQAGRFRDLSLRMVGLTADQRLICFREGTPQIATSIGFVSGLLIDTALVGIDYRVQDGLLYGVGNAGGVYTLNTDTAAATLVNRFTIPLSGAAFGVDFNPAADRLRVISNDGQNLRHNVNAGGVTLADTVLSYMPGTPATSVVGSAYTNNDLDANTATTLFDLDTALDQIVVQSPANSGTLAATGKLTVDAQALSAWTSTARCATASPSTTRPSRCWQPRTARHAACTKWN